jgi:NhaP-type Na+/H+ or K+/H+ antiporter
MILLLGTVLLWQPIVNYFGQSLLVIFCLFIIIRPLGVWISTIAQRSPHPNRRNLHPKTRWLLGWFGIRGIGSLYYLAYAFGNGLKGEVGEQISWIVYTTVVVSVIVHGISATPLMDWYERNIPERKSSPRS